MTWRLHQPLTTHWRRHLLAPWIALASMGTGCSEPGETPPTTQGAEELLTPVADDPWTSSSERCEVVNEASPSLGLQLVAEGLDLPSFAIGLPGQPEVLLVLEQPGRIRIIDGDELTGELFADLSDRVHTTLPGYSEWGLLGMAFHPDYETNGRVFIHYSSVERTDLGLSEGAGIIAEFQRSESNSRAIDPSSERVLLTVPQPEINHNGGGLEFSPRDGMLYIGLGDGGGQGDPSGYASNLSSLLGKMLRIDVDSTDPDRPYGIPEGNMTGDNVRPEVWSYGLRNPWRFSFDPCTADMYLGDVGQTLYEEVNLEPAGVSGRNYGWNTTEGRSCFNDSPDDPTARLPTFTAPEASCDTTGITFPVEELPHTGGSCSITAGFVYRGQAMPSLRGTYLYSDYCSGVFRSFRLQEGVAVARRDLTRTLNPNGLTTISSFGQDNNGELYVMTHSPGPFNLGRDAGALYRIVPAEEATTASPSEPPASDPSDAGASSDAGESPGAAASDAQAPTELSSGFASAVAPILQAQCTPCHASGGAGHSAASEDPAEAYAEAMAFAEGIVSRIEQGTMPPGCVQDATECVSEEDLATIRSWIEEGMAP